MVCGNSCKWRESGFPGNILFEADRLECQLFCGYDPKFDGDESPDL